VEANVHVLQACFLVEEVGFHAEWACEVVEALFLMWVEDP
jgi:hypothetical protein